VLFIIGTYSFYLPAKSIQIDIEIFCSISCFENNTAILALLKNQCHWAVLRLTLPLFVQLKKDWHKLKLYPVTL